MISSSGKIDLPPEEEAVRQAILTASAKANALPQSRSSSMVKTKLDEALLWLQADRL